MSVVREFESTTITGAITPLKSESLDNLTPADVYFGRSQTILLQREAAIYLKFPDDDLLPRPTSPLPSLRPLPENTAYAQLVQAAFVAALLAALQSRPKSFAA